MDHLHNEGPGYAALLVLETTRPFWNVLLCQAVALVKARKTLPQASFSFSFSNTSFLLSLQSQRGFAIQSIKCVQLVAPTSDSKAQSGARCPDPCRCDFAQELFDLEERKAQTTL